MFKARKETEGEEGMQKEKKGRPVWKKGIVIFLLIAAGIVLLGVACERMGTEEDTFSYDDDYIGVLEINGVMGEEGGDSLYNQEWLLNRIEDMEEDKNNHGLILSIDTPGGDVYAVDELYLKIMEYKKTGRPVYTYMRSMAASGGYYIAAASDKIYANRNTWTGSIGVTVGTFFDASEFLDKMGIRTVTITAGANKAMGTATEPMTEEQKGIMQGLVDDAYAQFTDIVHKGRKMDIDRVRELADGRVYTAKQALDSGLIDEIGSLEEAVSDMMKRYELGQCDSPKIVYEPDAGLLGLLRGESMEKKERTEIEEVLSMMEQNGKFTISYLSEIRK